eukprot:8747738-Lingulodinium_polyedra.AAC.1
MLPVAPQGPWLAGTSPCSPSTATVLVTAPARARRLSAVVPPLRTPRSRESLEPVASTSVP